MQMLSRETLFNPTNQKMIRRRSHKWINPTMQTNMKQKRNMCLNLIKMLYKEQYLQVSFSFQGIQIFSMDIVSVVETLDIRL
jgi:hypothetical protein